MTPAPEIETARLRLYPPRPEDLEVRLAMDRDPAVEELGDLGFLHGPVV